MRRVIIESPYAGDVERNLRYLRACLADSLARGEAPFASHAIYTHPGVLDDTKPEERRKGIEAGYVWWNSADAVVFYEDLGWSHGMREAKYRYNGLELISAHRPPRIEIRRLGGEWAR